MGLQIEWTLEGEKQLSRRLRNTAKAVSDLREPFEKSATKLQKVFEKDVFTSEGAAIDEKWQRLSPATVARKARTGGKMLVDTGEMQKSFKHKSAKDHAIIKNTAEYFKYHQSNRPRRKIPRRVMMKLAEPQRQIVVRELNKFLQKKSKK